MNNFQGKVKILAGEFRTLQELILAALGARTFNSNADLNAKQKAHAQSMWTATFSIHTKIKPATNVYLLDAYKGNTNGVIDQTKWAAADVTVADQGGGELLEGGIEHEIYERIGVASKLIYAAADTLIELNCTGPME